MKKYLTTVIVFLILSLAILAGFFVLMDKAAVEKRDIAYYNDAIRSIEEDYAAGVSLEELEETYRCTIILSTRIDDPVLAKHYADGDFVLDLAPEGDYIGKVAWEEKKDQAKDFRKTVTKAFLVFWILIVLFVAVVFGLIYVSLLRPEKKLSDFADEIAKGNLDIPLPMERGNSFGSLAEGLDLLREELLAAKEREVASDRAKKELVASLSHDIKTPVAVIQATCEVMELTDTKDMITKKREGADETEIAKTENRLEKLHVIRDKTETISHLMENVFQSTMSDLEELVFDVKEVSSAVIRDCFDGLKDYGNIVWEEEVPECLVLADPVRLGQAIDNVVSNSAKYAGTDIHVSCSLTEEIGDEGGKTLGYLSVKIRDEGPGVPDEELPFITEKYYRGTGAKEKTGYGLGLYLVKEYMERQGGGANFYNDGGFVAELLVRKV